MYFQGSSIAPYNISDSLYQSSTGQNRVDPPLKAGQSLTIGYGGGGSVPYTFNVRGSQKMEIGFLKLFLATEYADFSNIEQGSPFELSIRTMTNYQPKGIAGWDTLLVPFIVRGRSSTPSDIEGDTPHRLSQTKDIHSESFSPGGAGLPRTPGKISHGKVIAKAIRPLQTNSSDALPSSDGLFPDHLDMQHLKQIMDDMEAELEQLSTTQGQLSKDLSELGSRLEALDNASKE